MHPSILLTILPLLIALTTTTPTRTLQKRHFWCNGIDSETICPAGDTMVPIDSYACDQIQAAGRLNQISPPANGESHTTCANAPPPPASSSPSPSSSPAPPAGNTHPAPDPSSSFIPTGTAGVAGPTGKPKASGHKKEHLTCTQVGSGTISGGGSVMLNCTIDGAA